MKSLHLLAASLLAAPVFADLPAGAGWCSEVTISVQASATNVILANSPGPNNETAIQDYIHGVFQTLTAPTNGTINVSGTYHIAAVYCPPTVPVSKNVLQIIVHGLTYNKTMWFGLGYGSQYNYPLFAADHGYHTLVIDRLGHGQSQPFLDPINIVQVPLQLAIYHQVIQKIKSPHSPLPTCFDQYIWVGHSFGSLFGTVLAQNYPADVDGYVLTGISGTVSTAVTGTFNWPSAALVYPSRYAYTPLGYAVISTIADRIAAFYAGAYDPAIPVGDYRYADDLTVGEVGTLDLAFGFSNITTPVLAIAGSKDALVCTDPVLTCKQIMMATKAAYFPNATYSYYIAPKTGHDFSLHYSAPTTFEHIQSWANTYFNPL